MRTNKPIQVMKAPDMFNPDLLQRFNRKTGERIDYGYQELFEDPEPEPEKEPVIKEQLTLF